MSHASARLTPAGRLMLVRRIEAWTTQPTRQLPRRLQGSPREPCQSKTARPTAPKPPVTRAMHDQRLMTAGRRRPSPIAAEPSLAAFGLTTLGEPQIEDLKRLDCPAGEASGREPTALVPNPFPQVRDVSEMSRYRILPKLVPDLPG